MLAVILHPSDELALARGQKRFLEKSGGAWIPSFPLWAFFAEREPPLLDEADAASFLIEAPRTATEGSEFFFPVALVMKSGELFRGKIVAAKRRADNGAGNADVAPAANDESDVDDFAPAANFAGNADVAPAANDESNVDDFAPAANFAIETRFPISCRVFRAADVEITENGGTRTWFSRTSRWIKTRA